MPTVTDSLLTVSLHVLLHRADVLTILLGAGQVERATHTEIFRGFNLEDDAVAEKDCGLFSRDTVSRVHLMPIR